MAIIKCSECGKDVSSEAVSCPHCGCPIKTETNQTEPAQAAAPQLQQKTVCPTCGTKYVGNFCPNGCNSPMHQQKAKQKKKMGKGPIIAIVVVCVLAFCAIMGNLLGEEPSKETSGTNVTSITSSEESNSSKEDAEKVIYTDSNVRVSFIKVSDAADTVGVTACYIHLKVENIGSKTFTVSLTDAYANDSAVTVMSGLPMTLEPGKNSKQPFMFGYNEILSSADAVEKLEFKINLLDENWQMIKTSEKITVNVK